MAKFLIKISGISVNLRQKLVPSKAEESHSFTLVFQDHNILLIKELPSAKLSAVCQDLANQAATSGSEFPANDRGEKIGRTPARKNTKNRQKLAKNQKKHSKNTKNALIHAPKPEIIKLI